MAIMTRCRMPPEMFAEPLARRRHLHVLENPQGFALRRLPSEPAMVDQRLRDLETDRQRGVQARHRLLKDHRQGVAANLAHPFVGQT
jgi:hypothetical protein